MTPSLTPHPTPTIPERQSITRAAWPLPQKPPLPPLKPAHEILNAIQVGTIMNGNSSIALDVATETTYWKRKKYEAWLQGPSFQATVEKNLHYIPIDTLRLCQRESLHRNIHDPRPHITVVAYRTEGRKYVFHLHPEDRTGAQHNEQPGEVYDARWMKRYHGLPHSADRLLQ